MHSRIKDRNGLSPTARACALAIAGATLLVGARTADAQPYTWKSAVVGGGGFIDGFVFHPNARGIMYARTDMGGAYRWNAARANWIPITDWIPRGQDNDYGVLSIAVDPNDTGRVYLLTGKYTNSWTDALGGVLASSDGGRTFTRTALHAKIGGNEDGRGAGERIAVDPNLGSNLVLGTKAWLTVSWWPAYAEAHYGAGVWKSADYGKTWDSIETYPGGNVLFVAYDPKSGSKGSATKDIYVSSDTSKGQPATLYRSRDNGVTWAAVPGQPAGLKALRGAFQGDCLYLVFNNGLGPNGITKGEVWRLNTTTDTWKNISPTTGGFGFGGVSVDRQNPGHVLVSTIDRWTPQDQVFLSRDSGKTWSADLLGSGTIDLSLGPWAETRRPHWLASIEIDPFDSTHALFGTGYGAFRTTTLRAAAPSWTFADSNFEETVATQLVSPPAGPPVVSAMGDQGGFRHIRLDQPPPKVHQPDVGTTLSIEVAWKNPAVWAKAHNAAAPNGGKTYGSFSTDSGKTWTGFATQPPGAKSGGTRTIAVSADGSSIVWCPPGAAGCYASANNGGTWALSIGTVPPAGSIGSAMPMGDRVAAKKLYVYDMIVGAVHVSTNGGASFTKGATVLPTLPDYQSGDGVIATNPLVEGDVWVTTGAGGLFRSTNSASSFTKIAGVGVAYLVALGAPAAGATQATVYLWGRVGNVLGIFRSIDAGATWVRINDDQHQYGILHYLAADPNVFGRIFLATEGRGVIYGEPQSSVAVAPSAAARLPIALSRQGGAIVSATGAPITLYDLGGRLVRASSGARLDLAGLPGGVYLARSAGASLRVALAR